jgi:hypothetical protein
MQEAYGGVQPDRFKSRANIMHQKGVQKRQQAIDIIERRTAIPLVKGEGLFLDHDQLIEYTEVNMGRIPFDSPQHLQRGLPVYYLQVMAEPFYGMGNLIPIQPLGMIPHRPLQDGPTIGNLPGEYCPCHTRRKSRVIRFAVLLPT